MTQPMEDVEDFYGAESGAQAQQHETGHHTAIDVANIEKPDNTTASTAPSAVSIIAALDTANPASSEPIPPDQNTSNPPINASTAQTVQQSNPTLSSLEQPLHTSTNDTTPLVDESSQSDQVSGHIESTSHHETADETHLSTQRTLPEAGADQVVTAASTSHEDTSAKSVSASHPLSTHTSTHVDEAEAALAVAGGADHVMEDAVQPAGLEGPEFEVDDSPYESSSDDSSDTSSDDSDDDYKLMDPREQARLLMEDGGSDDEGGKKSGSGGVVRTQNEQIDEIVEMPDIKVTADMNIEELGDVAVILDNVALVKAKATGELKVLESSSLLCRADRKVIGVIAETIGRVEEPMYVVRFTNSTTLADFGLEVGSTVYFVPSHSRIVFTKALHVKGSDASNLHDEEVGENEMDFSDDEAEQAYKASLKRARQAKRGGKTSGPGDVHQKESYDRAPFSGPQPRHPGPVPMELSYDDNGASEDAYTPLARPPNLADLMRQVVPGEEQSQPSRSTGAGRGGDGSYRGRGRGDRGGRDRGGRGRGRGRGDFAGRGRGRDFDRQDGQSQQYPPQQHQPDTHPSQWNSAASGQNYSNTYASPANAPMMGQSQAPTFLPAMPQFQVPTPGQFPPFNLAAFPGFGSPAGAQGGYPTPQWAQQSPQYPQAHNIQNNAPKSGQQSQQNQHGAFDNAGLYGNPRPGANPNSAQPEQFHNPQRRQ